VRIGSERSALVAGKFDLPSGVREVEVEIGREGRSARVDGKPVRDPDELFGGLATVAFTPDDLAVVKGGPEGRRRLLDRAVQNRHPAHLADARDYQRALRSRNEILRQGADPALLASFDEPLARLGARLRTRRRGDPRGDPARPLRAPLRRSRAVSLLCSRPTSPQAATRTTWPAAAGASLETRLSRRFAGACHAIASAGTPASAPMRTTWGYRSAKGPRGSTRARGSRGQWYWRSRSAKIENLRRAQGRPPLLLLDDVSSELDPERNAWLMQYLAALEGQVVLTTTDLKLVAKSAVKEALFQRAAGGRIAPENPLFSE